MRVNQQNAPSLQAAGLKLPPPPTLSEKHFRVESITVDGLAPVEVLKPAAEPFLCRDPRAPALVLIPGLGMDSLGFLRQLPLGSRAELHLIQTPNGPVQDEQGLGHFARGVEAYIKSRELERRPGGVVLGGCSMGGALTLAVALRGRVKLRGVVLLGTFGSSRHLPRWQRTLAPLGWMLPWRMGRKVTWKLGSRFICANKIAAQEADWIVSSRFRRTQGYFGRAIMAVTHMEMIEAARKLDVPALVIHGTKDRVLPLAAGVELAEAIPGARLLMLQDAGHALFFTHQEPVNEAIAEFLTAINRP